MCLIEVIKGIFWIIWEAARLAEVGRCYGKDDSSKCHAHNKDCERRSRFGEQPGCAQPNFCDMQITLWVLRATECPV
jgi:hypothetical protein